MSSTPSDGSPSGRLAGLLARLFWMLAGNALLALLTISIAFRDGTSLSPSDVAFWTVVALLVVVRWADVRLLGGETADGEPATTADWRRYTAMLIAISLAVWLAAHASAHLGLLG